MRRRVTVMNEEYRCTLRSFRCMTLHSEHAGDTNEAFQARFALRERALSPMIEDGLLDRPPRGSSSCWGGPSWPECAVGKALRTEQGEVRSVREGG